MKESNLAMSASILRGAGFSSPVTKPSSHGPSSSQSGGMKRQNSPPPQPSGPKPVAAIANLKQLLHLTTLLLANALELEAVRVYIDNENIPY